MNVEADERGLHAAMQSNRLPGPWSADLATGLAFYYLSSLLVIIAAAFSFDFVQPVTRHRDSGSRVSVVSSLAAWDGQWYRRIAEEGYSYEPDRESTVNFYPAYPAAAALVSRATGLSAELALLVVSHLSLAAAFVLIVRDVRLRFATADVDLLALLCLGLYPAGYFFRAAYSESTFLLLAVMTMYGIHRRWPIVIVALIAGLATATRPVGLALLAPVGMTLWSSRRSLSHFLVRSAYVFPLAVWGIVAYMLYQRLAFGTALAFLENSVHWYERPLPDSLVELVWALITLEPIRAVYDPASPCYWAADPPDRNPLWSLLFANPLYFLAAWVLLVIGAWRKWLSREELVLGILLLLIPYALQAYRGCMVSAARYTTVVFPIYFVLGNLLARVPAALSGLVAAALAVFMFLYTSLFCAWYWFF